jgi:branched-chain amino acid transport system ATP-binding protein
MSHYDDEAMSILERVGLAEIADREAVELSHGEKRSLEVAVVIARHPEVLLLDEPTAGMSQAEIDELLDLIDELADEFTVLLVEHNMQVVMSVSDVVMVLHDGQLLAEGEPEQIQQNRRVREAYLGGEV